jgi:hypothetical protein
MKVREASLEAGLEPVFSLASPSPPNPAFVSAFEETQGNEVNLRTEVRFILSAEVSLPEPNDLSLNL